jgi:hypothetical protein
MEVVRSETGETATVTRYNTVNSTRDMEFAGQAVTELKRREDGTQVKVISRYGAASPGRSIPASGREASLREQEIVEQQVRRDGTVVETTTVRRGDLSDRGRLGPPQLVSEVVCSGNCLAPAPAASKEEGEAEEASEK